MKRLFLKGIGIRKWVLPICLFTFLPLSAGDVSVSSPNNKLQVTVSDAGGRLFYTATLDGRQMLLPSALGLKTSLGDLTKELSIVNSQLSAVSNTYTMRGTKASSADYKANRLLIDLQSKDGVKMSLVFQVSDNDIAFRYEIPRQKIKRFEYKRARILAEASSFNFPDQAEL